MGGCCLYFVSIYVLLVSQCDLAAIYIREFPFVSYSTHP